METSWLQRQPTLLEQKIQTPELHLPPKIHKASNPGRPVISSVNCHTRRISEFVGYYLQPEVKKIKSYVKDATDFIKSIEAIYHVSDDSDLPYKHTTCIPRWNEVEITVSTSFQRGIHMVWLYGSFFRFSFFIY